MTLRDDRTGVTAGALGTALVHGGLIVLVLATVQTRAPAPPVYAVNLVAAPLPTSQRRLAPEAVTPPAPSPPAPVEPAKKTVAPEAPPKAKAKATPLPSPSKQTITDPSREPSPPTKSQAQPLAGETPSTGTDVATIRTPGLEFPFPEYLRNIMNQVLKYWGGSNSAYRAEVSFLILQDGSVRDIRLVKRSGNYRFDLNAQGAIEAAGNAHAFGPLPTGWDANLLPVTFVFEPRN